MFILKCFSTASVMGILNLCLASSAGAAVIISTYDHDGNGFASGTGADAYVSENAASAGYGALGEVQMRNQPGTHLQMPYYQFDLSAIESSQVRTAKLQVYDFRYGGSGQLDGQDIEVWALSNDAIDGWDEAGLTWNNAPGRTDNGTAYDGPDFNSDATSVGTFTFTRSGSTPWSVPFEVPGLADLVRDDGNDRLTLMFVGPAGGTLYRTGAKESSQTSLWIADSILAGTAATRLHVETNTTIVSTYDHDGDGLASGNGADTYITEYSKTANAGSAGFIQFRDQAGTQQQVGYCRFDISAFEGGGLVDAQMQLYDYRFSEGNLLSGRTLSIWGLRDGSLDNWSESAITWNDAPGHTDDGIEMDDADFNTDAVYLGDVTFVRAEATNGWSIPLDVPGLADFIAADSNGLVTLMVTAETTGSLYYAGSKESVYDRRINDPLAIAEGTIAPRLLLTVPEPATWLLLVTLLTFCGLRPRRLRQANRPH